MEIKGGIRDVGCKRLVEVGCLVGKGKNRIGEEENKENEFNLILFNWVKLD